MRQIRENNGLKICAVAGTYVVMFGFNMPQENCSGLLGFSIHREDRTEQEAYFLKAMKCFSETDL